MQALPPVACCFDARFELLFERFEILGALSYLEANSVEEVEKTLKKGGDFLWMPIGGSVWHEQNTERIVPNMQSELAKGELAKAGFAGSNCLINLYIENFKRMVARVRHM